MINIIQAVIDVEFQFGNYPHYLAYSPAKFTSY
jgi:hypothetical protein